MISRTKLPPMKKSSGHHSEKIVTLKGRRFLFRVEDSNSPSDYLKYEELRNAVWQYPGDSLPGGRTMMGENFLQDGSSLFIGDFVEDENGVLRVSGGQPVGCRVGFWGFWEQ